jgi:hypothetical protein
MIVKSRLYARVASGRSAKKIYIISEGENREVEYFRYFEEIDSRITFIFVERGDHEGTSPADLLKRAKEEFSAINNSAGSEENLKAFNEDNYILAEEDELWFVIDTDIWGQQINDLRKVCDENEKWFIAQSNPCFEVWLYYHVEDKKPDLTCVENFNGWKSYVNNVCKGGFDPRKHPVLIETAIKNSKANFSLKDDEIDFGCTEVHNLAESFYPLISEKIKSALKIINEHQAKSSSNS